ncbi:MAG: GvpL/GvpF family gas vesicle protein [Methanoregula sp.]
MLKASAIESVTRQPSGTPADTARVKNPVVSSQEDTYKDRGTAKNGGLYLYALVESKINNPTGITGIDGQPVFAIPYRDVSAMVHACPVAPYKSDNQEVVTRWVMSHEHVLEEIISRGMNTIPFTFDTIIKPEKEREAGEVLTRWLSREYEVFLQKFEKVRKKKEYGIQVFADRNAIRDAIAATSGTIQGLEDEAKKSGPGKMYLIRQKMEKELKSATDAKIGIIISEITEKIRSYCDEITMNKLRKGTGLEQDMILNCSCLVTDENYPRLGAVLEEIDQAGNLSVRFTGPWAVYSFV